MKLFAQYDTAQSGEYDEDIAQHANMTQENADKYNEKLRANGSDLRWVEVREHRDEFVGDSECLDMPSYNS